MSNSSANSVTLKAGREKSVRAMHPWIFSGAIQGVEGNPRPGENVEVYAKTGEWLCRGAYNPQSNIRIRVWSWDPDEPLNLEFFRTRIQKALALRASAGLAGCEMLRLVNAESDGLPGLIVDRYGEVLVVQVLSAGIEAQREAVVSALAELPGVNCIFERSDQDVRKLEGLPMRTGLLYGNLPEKPLVCRENGLLFKIDFAGGHKTGFYLDQRQNRLIFKNFVAGKDVLNCFSYTGGFSAAALAGGAAQVTSIDSSADVLALGEENIQLNELDAGRHASLEEDVFKQLRAFRDQGRSFDVIVLDPPKFAPTAAQAQRAARGYKDINLLAFKLLRPGGILFTFSCSGGVSADLFQKIVASAALDAGVQAAILQHMSQDADHPVRLSFPEGSYLKGLICRLDG